MNKSSPEQGFFPERLRTAREKAQLTQAELEARCGIPAAAISHFESGNRKPSFANLKKLADALGVNIDYLLGRQVEVESAGEEAQVLFRGLSDLTVRDRQIIADLIQAMKDRAKEK